MNDFKNYIFSVVFFSMFITILEMLLPSGNSKKYVRLICGIILTYIVVSPVISIFMGEVSIYDKALDEISNIDFSYNYNQKKIETNQEEYVKIVFEKEMKKDIIDRIQQIGYVIDNVKIKYEIDNTTSNCKISEIEFVVIDRTIESIQTVANVEGIKTIKIALDPAENNQANERLVLSLAEKEEIINLLVSTYQVRSENIYII